MRPAYMRLHLATACVAVLGGARAEAQTCGTAASWSTTNEVGNASLAVTNSVSGTSSSTYLSIGSTVHGLNASTGASIGTFTTGGAIQTAATAAPLADGNWYLFVTSFDGRVYKLGTSNVSAVWSGGKDLRRSSCTTDELNATPAVQLAAYSSTAFRTAHGGMDLVYVITRYGCSTSSANRVYALDAATGNVVWTFNATGSYAMDFGSEGCSIDYDTDRIYCGTNQPTLASQSTLWAISTIDGSLAWSTNAGSLQNRPELGTNGSRIYVANMNGAVSAYSSAGALVWSQAVSLLSFLRNPWVEFRAPYAGHVYVTDSNGTLYDVKDNGTSATTSWSVGPSLGLIGKRVKGTIGISPADGYAYAGLDDGTVHQISLANGSDVASRTIGSSSDVTSEPNLDTNASGAIGWITISAQDTSGVITKRFCLPWIAGSTGS